MAQAGQLILVSTDPATQLTGGLTQNAAATLNLASGPGLPALGHVDEGLAAGRTLRSRLKTLSVIAVQNLAWECWLWGTATFNASLTDPALVFPLARWYFGEADGVRIAAGGLFYYYSDGNDQPYLDLDGLGQIHLMVVNRSSTSKLAGAAGAVRVQLALEPTTGW